MVELWWASGTITLSLNRATLIILVLSISRITMIYSNIVVQIQKITTIMIIRIIMLLLVMMIRIELCVTF